VEAVEEPVPLERLAGAGEVFLTSSIRGLQALGGCEDAGTWTAGPVGRRLAADLCRAWLGEDHPRPAEPTTTRA